MNTASLHSTIEKALELEVAREINQWWNHIHLQDETSESLLSLEKVIDELDQWIIKRGGHHLCSFLPPRMDFTLVDLVWLARSWMISNRPKNITNSTESTTTTTTTTSSSSLMKPLCNQEITTS